MSKLICPNCGSHVALPEHSSLCMGITLSKEGNDTHYLKMEKENNTMTFRTTTSNNNTTTKENKTMTRAEQRIATLKAQGIDTSNYFAINEDTVIKMENGIPSVVMEEVVEQIKADGDIFNRYLDGRWIMAQMMHMLNDNTGYTEALKRKGYFYQWEFIADELHRMAKRQKQNDRLAEKERWFNSELITGMIKDYANKLLGYLDTLPKRNCKGVSYIRLGNKYERFVNQAHGDVFVADIYKKVIKKYLEYIASVKKCRNYFEMERVVREFMKKMVVLPFATSMDAGFVDAYKGNGAYYTINNLIRFHGCVVYHDRAYARPYARTKEESLDVLNDYSASCEGYELLGFLKQMIADNNFSYNNR